MSTWTNICVVPGRSARGIILAWYHFPAPADFAGLEWLDGFRQLTSLSIGCAAELGRSLLPRALWQLTALESLSLGNSACLPGQLRLFDPQRLLHHQQQVHHQQLVRMMQQHEQNGRACWRQLRRLRRLDASACLYWSDGWCAELAEGPAATLEVLDLGLGHVTDAGVTALAALQQLTSLDLRVGARQTAVFVKFVHVQSHCLQLATYSRTACNWPRLSSLPWSRPARLRGLPPPPSPRRHAPCRAPATPCRSPTRPSWPCPA